MKSLKKEINFDGSKFWFRDLPIGEIEDKYKFESPIPKQVLDAKKDKILGEIIGVR